MKHMKAVIMVAVAIAIVMSLAGCQTTITVTGKMQNFLGWYYLCDASGSLFGHKVNPCIKNHEYRVSQQVYDTAQIGQTVTLNY